MLRLFTLVGSILSPFIGRISWKAPLWMHWIGRTIRQNPKSVALGFLLIVAVGGGYYYYLQLPVPLQYRAEADIPDLSQVVDDELQIDQLTIRFSYDEVAMVTVPDHLGPASVANLELMDKPLLKGVGIRPAIEGEWRWNNDHVLTFVPEHDWPAGREYTVTFSPGLFAKDTRLASDTLSFVTPPFSARLESMEFYQDPVDRTTRRVISTLDFSHAVDEESLKEHLALEMRPSGADIDVAPEPYEYTVRFDKHHRKAFVQTLPIELPEKANFMKLHLDEDVKSALGSATLERPVDGEVRIPDIYSFFRVSSASANIVRNQEDQPEQIVTIEFTDDVDAGTLHEAFQLYLLPERSRSWQGPREVTAEVLKNSRLVQWQAIPNQRDAEKLYNFRVDVPHNRTLYMKIEGGLVSINQFKMTSDYDSIIRVPAYPHELKIMNEGSVLALSGEHKLGLLSRNLEAVKVEVGRVLPGQINHLISQTSGDISNPGFNNYYFDEQNLSQYSDQLTTLTKKHPKEANYAAFDLSGYLKDGPDYGLFFVTVQGWRPEQDTGIHNARDKRLILVTDLGLIVKDNADHSHDLFVQSIRSGKPVANAEIQLLGKNGLPVMQARTDANGHARMPSTAGLEKQKQPTVYLVRNGKDIAFLPFNRSHRQLNFSRFDVGGLHTRNLSSDALNAFVFSDRGIYRPGDKVNLAAIVRQQNFTTPASIPLEIEIRNPRGNVTLKKRMRLPDLGFLDVDYSTDATAETGYYNATVYLVRDKRHRRQLGSTRFQVEEFQPDRLKISSRIIGAPTKGWMSADKLRAEVKLKNLFGTPAQDRKITTRMQLTPTAFHFAEYKDYRFDDPSLDPEKPRHSVSRMLPEGRTDADGLAQFELPLQEYVQGTYRLTLDVQGFEEGGGRSVSASSSILLSPFESLVGFKVNSRLSYLHKGSEQTIHFIVIDRQLKQTAREDLRIKLIERQNVSILVRQSNGTYKYQTVVKEKPLQEKPFAIARDGSDFTLPTERPGDFVLQVFDSKDQRLSQVTFSVVGQANLAGALEKNAELNLKLNKNDYRPGETIEMNISAPYTGTGLITIESDRVHVWKWFHSETTSSMQTIRVPDSLEGNAYVNVSFVRAADSPEIYVSPLSYAVAPFSIDRSQREVSIQLEVPKVARPGKAMKVGYTASRPGRIAVFAVDEGILQVAKYRTPKPLDHFFKKQALEVRTQQMVDLILPEYSLMQERSASGGGMSEMAAEALGRNLNPFARNVDRPVAFWSGIVEAGPEQRSVRFDIPESFSGQLRVMAVAVSEEAMGSTQQRTTVRGPFVISPNMLTVAAPGDEFAVTVGLSNLVEGSGDQARIRLSASPSEHLELLGEPTRTLTIAEGSESRADFRFRARSKPGAASVVFSADMDKADGTREDGRITATLSVRPAVPYMASFASGYAASGEVSVPLDRRLYPELAEQQASASASPLVLVDGLNTYLENFPHGCTEQVVSQVFPLIGLMSHPGYAGQAEQTHSKVAKLITRLRPRQLASGGFSLWPGGRSPAEFPSVYVMHFLTEARELGYPVPADLYSRGLEYLRGVSSGTPGNLESARVQAAAIYLLTRNGEVTTNDLVHLQEHLQRQYKDGWQQDLTAVYMASTYHLLKKQDEAGRLVSDYRIGSQQPDHYSDFQSPLTQDAQYLYLLASHFPDRLRALKGEGVRELVEPVFGGHYNTIGSAYTILSLGAYSKAVLGDQGSEQIIMKALVDNVATALEVNPQPFVTARPGVKASEVKIEGRQPLFYQVSQAGYDLAVPTQALSEGLEIQRDYLDSNGNEVNSLTQGEEVTVRLRIRSLESERVTNVAVIDLLPGGFEVIRSSVPRRSSAWSADYVDIREDRVVFYGGFGRRVTELKYRARLTASGEFVIPPAYAEAMYNRSVHGRSVAGKFSVSDSE